MPIRGVWGGGWGGGGWGGGGGGAQRPFICFHLLQTATLIPIPCVGCVCGTAFLSSIFVCVWEVGGSNGLSGMNNSWFFSGLYGWVKMGKRVLSVSLIVVVGSSLAMT